MRNAGSFRNSVTTLFSLLLLAAGCAAGASQARGNAPGPMEAGNDGQPTPSTHVDEGTQDPQSRPGIAVLPFDNGGSFGSDPWDYEALGIGLQQMLITELAQNSSLRLVERGRIREIIDELDLGQSQYTDASTAAQIGRLVQARYLISGGFTDANGTMRLDARVFDVETSEILTETAARVQDDREDLLDMVVELGVQLVEAANLPPLPQNVVEERMGLDYPPEAIRLYSRALRREEQGDQEGMVELLRQLTTEFPQHIEGMQMLEQAGGNGQDGYMDRHRRTP